MEPKFCSRCGKSFKLIKVTSYDNYTGKPYISIKLLQCPDWGSADYGHDRYQWMLNEEWFSIDE